MQKKPFNFARIIPPFNLSLIRSLCLYICLLFIGAMFGMLIADVTSWNLSMAGGIFLAIGGILACVFIWLSLPQKSASKPVPDSHALALEQPKDENMGKIEGVSDEALKDARAQLAKILKPESGRPVAEAVPPPIFAGQRKRVKIVPPEPIGLSALKRKAIAIDKTKVEPETWGKITCPTCGERRMGNLKDAEKECPKCIEDRAKVKTKKPLGDNNDGEIHGIGEDDEE